MSRPLELCEWLSTATRGLPKSIKSLVYDELCAHYEDTLDDLQGEGMGLREAHQVALAQLGDARLTAAALQRTHLATRRYRQAALVAILSMLSFVLGAFFTIQPVLFLLIGVGSTAYVLHTLEYLVTLDRADKSFKLPIGLIVFGTLLIGMMNVCAGDINGASPCVIVLTDPFTITRLDLFAQPLTVYESVVSIVIALIGIGWLWLCESVLQPESTLQRFAFPLQLCLFGVGLGLIGVGAALLLRNSFALNLFNLLVIISGTTRQALLTYIFIRAARTNTANPYLHA